MTAAVIRGDAAWCDFCGLSHKPGPSCLDSTPWHLPATRPAVVLDPFGGTGTTALLADTLGRIGISIDRSGDYSRLARWRTTDPGERARALEVDKPPQQVDGQGELFTA